MWLLIGVQLLQLLWVSQCGKLFALLLKAPMALVELWTFVS